MSDAPSRPLSRTSRAESIGSLADYSQHGGYWGSNIVPADYNNYNTQQQVGILIGIYIMCKLISLFKKQLISLVT